MNDIEGRHAIMRAEAAYMLARASFDKNGEPLYTEAQLDALRDWIATAKGWSASGCGPDGHRCGLDAMTGLPRCQSKI